jgi:translation initiation factor eIF-2B subunit epsilon
MLQNYLINSKWSTILSIKCITSTSCLSAGDALRELDAMGVIRSDPFILISGESALK